MKLLILAFALSPIFDHAGGEACEQRATSYAQYEYGNAVRYAQSSDSFPEDKKYAACAGIPLHYDGATPETNDSNYQYYLYSFSADCAPGVTWKYSIEFYPSLNCELRGE